MPLSVGTRIGPYEVTASIGAGGMGEVYRAKDTKLGRDVAIKVLPPGLAGDASHMIRFRREAQVLASLNHPNIAIIHGLEESGDITALVMEFVEGETLEARLRKGALAPEQAVRLAIRIAEALEAAHRKGIVHRDLKPANVILTKAGVKLLDFGLAKLVESPAASPLTSEAAATMTMAAPVTRDHTILGTPQYMAPEQIEGRECDTRSDLFAFGCVLYEMLSGHRAFDGKSATTVMAAILEREPNPIAPILSGPLTTLDWIARCCLKKEPDDRVQSAHDLQLMLEQVANQPRPVSAAKRRPFVAAAGYIFGVLCAGVLAFIVWKGRTPPSGLNINLQRLTSDTGVTSWPAISADGKLVAYASDRDGGTNLDLYVEQVGGGHPARLTRTDEDESEPDFSPDGTFLAFRSERAGGGIYTMPALGGEPRLLVRDGQTPRWSPDGKWIVYWTGVATSGNVTGQGSGRVFIVPSSGGVPRQIDPGFNGRFPTWSPDGRRILFFGTERGTGETRADYWVVPLVEGGKPEPTGLVTRLSKAKLIQGPTQALTQALTWTSYGLVIKLQNQLYRIPLDSRGKARSDPVPITASTEIPFNPSVSHAGKIVFSSGSTRNNIWGLPLDGNKGKVLGPPFRITDSVAHTGRPSLSLDGSKLLFESDQSGRVEIWQKNLVTGKEIMMVTDPEGSFNPRFLRLSGRVTYRTRAGAYLFDPASGESRKIAERAYVWDADSRDELALLCNVSSSPAGVDVLNLKTGERTKLLLSRQWALWQAYFAPDDRWIVFQAITGPTTGQIFSARFQGMKAIPESEWIPITDGTGHVDKPRFSPDGKLIYFTVDAEGSRSIHAVRFDPQSGHAAGEPFLVYDFHGRRLSMLPVGLGPLEMSVAQDKLVGLVAESTSNIWMAELGKE